MSKKDQTMRKLYHAEYCKPGVWAAHVSQAEAQETKMERGPGSLDQNNQYLHRKDQTIVSN